MLIARTAAAAVWLTFSMLGARTAGIETAPADLHFRDVRKFGRMILTPDSLVDALPALAKLGPDATEIGRDEFTALLAARRTRIKPLLLDQRRLAGMGNIYVDESLYQARIHPLTPACDVPLESAAELWRIMRRVLRAAIKAGGTSKWTFVDAAGEQGWFAVKLKVYARAGAPCGRCGTPIERIVVGGRGTHLCPRCQPAP